MYDKLSEERKRLQKEGNMPEWYSTAGWQMFKNKYLYQADHPRDQYQRIASTLAVHSPDPDYYRKMFFDIMWKGWFSPSTPLLANTGTSRGLPVSCAGNYIGDNLSDIYQAKHEVAMLTKMGFGTASYLGDIRSRGSSISIGGKAEGVMPIIKGIQQDMQYVSQGTSRRGAWAGYLPIDHGDFDEVADYLASHPDDNNIGWNISDEVINILKSDPTHEYQDRYQKAMGAKMPTGKGYFFFPDKANRKRPQCYVDHGLYINAPQLCNEIMLFNDKDHTYTCVLGSMNAALWNEWKGTNAVHVATVLLDCVVQEFLDKAKHIPGLEKAVRMTEKGRAIGLGVCGFHTYLQQEMIPYESFDAHLFNQTLFKHINEESTKASEWLAEELGEPEWCKGYGVRNTHRMAVAPTKSTALIMGGISEGISPDQDWVFTQRTTAGEVDRVNPIMLKLMKERGVYNKRTLEDLREKQSVQHVDWLSDHEKMVFRNAFEIDQFAVLRMASSRAPFIDQWQSMNLFFAAGSDENYINEVTIEAFLDENILGVYYFYSRANVQSSQDKSECEACM